MCLQLDLNIHLRIAERRPSIAPLAADLSARDLQQQFYSVHTADKGFALALIQILQPEDELWRVLLESNP